MLLILRYHIIIDVLRALVGRRTGSLTVTCCTKYILVNNSDDY